MRELYSIGALPSVLDLTLGKLTSLPIVFFQHSAKSLFTECNYFAEYFFRSTRHKACLPSIRENALGKEPVSGSDRLLVSLSSMRLLRCLVAATKLLCLALQ